MAKDHYQTLQVDRAASTLAIKAAFRRLAKEVHPDQHPNDPAATARFQEIAAAYETLVDDAKRAAYDLQQRSSPGHSQSYAASTPWYEPPVTTSRIERAIEVLSRLRAHGGYEPWRKEVHAWAFFRAQDEAYELQAALRGQGVASVPSQTERDHIEARLQRFNSAMTTWKSYNIFKAADGVDQPGDHDDRSRVTFITNPDAAAVKARIERECRSFVNRVAAPGGDNIVTHMADPECWNRVSFTLGARTHVALLPALIRLTDVQMNLDVLLLCAAYAKKQWMGRWMLDTADNAEFLFRAAIAAEIVGVKTLGYEIPLDRRTEAEWVKARADRRMFHTGGSDQAGKLALARWHSMAQCPHQVYARERRSPFPLHLYKAIAKERDLAGPIDRVLRAFRPRQQRYIHTIFENEP